jgi:hypothetical protein
VAIALVYAGLLTIAAGLVSIVRPLGWLAVPSRRRAAIVLGAGVLVAMLGALLPAPRVEVTSRVSRLDAFVPAYQFNEVHDTEIHASPETIFTAIKQVTAGEITLYRTLTWIRSPRLGATDENILAAPAGKPLLDVATRSGFLLLADEPPREVVFGGIGFGSSLGVSRKQTPQDFLEFDRAGYAKMAMNFTIAPRADGWSTLRTETRVYATDAGARRRFAAYWRVIAPGSAVIRVMWLRAIKKRAEGHS